VEGSRAERNRKRRGEHSRWGCEYERTKCLFDPVVRRDVSAEITFYYQA
jgi:hypothetical protein